MNMTMEFNPNFSEPTQAAESFAFSPHAAALPSSVDNLGSFQFATSTKSAAPEVAPRTSLWFHVVRLLLIVAAVGVSKPAARTSENYIEREGNKLLHYQDIACNPAYKHFSSEVRAGVEGHCQRSESSLGIARAGICAESLGFRRQRSSKHDTI